MTPHRSNPAVRAAAVLLLALAMTLGGLDTAQAGDRGKAKGRPAWQDRLDAFDRIRRRLDELYGGTPRNHGQMRREYAQRGGNRADSNPTSVPILDGDLAFMVHPTDEQVGVREAHAVTRGGGVLVAVLDGGFNLGHPDVAGRMLPWGYDAVDRDFDPEDLGNGWDDDLDGMPDRTVGHGTFVAGMILRAAPEATILPVRVRDDEGWGTNVELERGLEWAWRMGAQVVNISGESTHGRSHHVAELLRAMRADGVVIVNSAGNDGLDEISELGYWNDTLTVGAVDRYDRVASFSNLTEDRMRLFVYGPGVDQFGPLGRYQDGTSGLWSGTSFATGWVSGAAALLRSIRPDLDAWQLMYRLRHAVAPVRSQDGAWMGHGRIHLGRVVMR